MDPTLRPRWLLWLLFAGSLATAAMAAAGYAMVASAPGAHPGRGGHWQVVGWVYLGLAALSIAGVIAAILALRRDTREQAAATKRDE